MFAELRVFATVVDENGEMILRSEQRADVAMQRKIGPLCALDGLGHVRVGGVHQISHLAAYLLLPARESMNVFINTGVGLVCTHGMMIPRIKGLLPGSSDKKVGFVERQEE